MYGFGGGASPVVVVVVVDVGFAVAVPAALGWPAGTCFCAVAVGAVFADAAAKGAALPAEVAGSLALSAAAEAGPCGPATFAALALPLALVASPFTAFCERLSAT